MRHQIAGRVDDTLGGQALHHAVQQDILAAPVLTIVVHESVWSTDRAVDETGALLERREEHAAHAVWHQLCDHGHHIIPYAWMICGLPDLCDNF